MRRALSIVWFLLVPGLSLAGGAERTERQHARHEAAQLELLQRSSSRPGVEATATSHYLDRFGHLDARAVRRTSARSWELSQRSGVVYDPPVPPTSAVSQPPASPSAVVPLAIPAPSEPDVPAPADPG